VIPGGTATGIGLRSPHHAEVLATRPRVGWLEVHAENFYAAGGAAPRLLARVREQWPLSLHGVGLSLGGTDPLSRMHLDALRRLVRDFEPALVSEHACWSSFDGVHYNDLLPLPYTEEALRHLVQRVAAVQDHLGRRILVENVSSYVQFAASTLGEGEFLAALAAESGCGLLLDVNNVYVSARNHRLDPLALLDAVPVGTVGEIHVAGHSRVEHAGREILIDTHGAPVCDDVWRLYTAALARFGDVPTLVEWDADLPPLSALLAEAHRADEIRDRALAVAA
jgi:uncharacterized protein (UPF0276 family)